MISQLYSVMNCISSFTSCKGCWRCIRIPESQELQELRQNIVKYSHVPAKIRKSVRV